MTNDPTPTDLGIHVHQTQGLASKGSQVFNLIQNNYPHTFKHLAATHTGSITFAPASLRDVILKIAAISDELEQKPRDFISIQLEEKNRINNLSDEFYNEIIARDYEPYFTDLDAFLKARENEDLHGLIGKITKNLNKKIIASHRQFPSFELLLLSIEDKLVDTEYDELNGKEDTVSLFLFYLYANCYIGKKTVDEIV